MKKILCATDGTAHSAHAVELSAEMAKKLGAHLSICVVNVANGGSRGPLIYSMEDDQVKKVLELRQVGGNWKITREYTR